MPIRFVCPVCWAVREGIDDSLLGKMIKCHECHAMAMAKHSPAPNDQRGRPERRATAVPIATAELVEQSAAPASWPNQVLLSSGDIPYRYEIVDLVFVHGSSAQGVLKGALPPQALRTIAQWLGQAGLQIGANAVINIRLDFRRGQGTEPFEIYGYGTAVRLIAER